MSEEREAPTWAFDPKLVLRRLFARKISPVQAAIDMAWGFEREGLTRDQAYERIRQQHQFYQEENLGLRMDQRVAWDDLTILLESKYNIPDEDRVSRNRLVPLDTDVSHLPIKKFDGMPF